MKLQEQLAAQDQHSFDVLLKLLPIECCPLPKKSKRLLMPRVEVKSQRGPGAHFTPEEKKVLRTRHDEGCLPHDVAIELKCSVRNVHKWYAIFEGRTTLSLARTERAHHVIKAKPKSVVDRASRFYKSDFEPS